MKIFFSFSKFFFNIGKSKCNPLSRYRNCITKAVPAANAICATVCTSTKTTSSVRSSTPTPLNRWKKAKRANWSSPASPSSVCRCSATEPRISPRSTTLPARAAVPSPAWQKSPPAPTTCSSSRASTSSPHRSNPC